MKVLYVVNMLAEVESQTRECLEATFTPQSTESKTGGLTIVVIHSEMATIQVQTPSEPITINTCTQSTNEEVENFVDSESMINLTSDLSGKSFTRVTPHERMRARTSKHAQCKHQFPICRFKAAVHTCCVVRLLQRRLHSWRRGR